MAKASSIEPIGRISLAARRDRPLTEAGLPEVFSSVESEVRSYCRGWPTVMQSANDSWVTDTEGRRYIDFFAGAGALNYGHNNPLLKAPLLDYLASDGIVHSLDIATEAKQRFLETFQRVILEPRGLDFRCSSRGPRAPTPWSRPSNSPARSRAGNRS